MTQREAGTGPLLSRRTLIRAGGVIGGAAVLPAPFIRPSYAARSLRISSYGGICEQTFARQVYPAFTKASGIEVVSIPEAEGLTFLLQLNQANRNGAVPMDLAMLTPLDILRARQMQLLRPFEAGRIATLGQIPAHYVSHGPQGIDGVGVMAWYMALVYNTQQRPQAPDSWRVFWEKSDQPVWGVVGQGGLSNLFDITAQVFFGGNQILEHREGIDQVVAHMAQAKPNIQLWWEDEGTMQTALQNEEVVGGTYFNDDANTLAKAGAPFRSIFPKEGPVEDYGCWCQPTASRKIDEAHEFIAFSCTPQAQSLIALHEGSAPVMEPSKLALPDGVMTHIKPAGPAISMNYAVRLQQLDYMTAKFNRMISS